MIRALVRIEGVLALTQPLPEASPHREGFMVVRGIAEICTVTYMTDHAQTEAVDLWLKRAGAPFYADLRWMPPAGLEWKRYLTKMAQDPASMKILITASSVEAAAAREVGFTTLHLGIPAHAQVWKSPTQEIKEWAEIQQELQQNPPREGAPPQV